MQSPWSPGDLGLSSVIDAIDSSGERYARDRLYELTAGPFDSDALWVARFKGRMAMNELYQLDVDFRFALGTEADLEDMLLDEPARLTMHARGASSSIHGVVAAVSTKGNHIDGGMVGTLRIVPRMARLRHTKTSRIFQNMTVVQIVGAVLAEHGIAREWKISRTYPEREYCVQYQESDYELVTRLLAEDGIMFFFRHVGAGSAGSLLDVALDVADAAEQFLRGDPRPHECEVLVMADDAQAYPELAGGGSLVYRHESQAEEKEASISEFSFRTKTGPESVFMREYDFHRPQLELAWRAWGRDAEAALGSQTRIYDHHAEYQNPDAVRNASVTRLEQHRARLAGGMGRGSCRRMLPGHTFTLDEHSLPHLNGEYVVTSVEVEGYSPWVAHLDRRDFDVRFRGVRADVPFRPNRPERAPRQVVETAVVVGPPGEEIHTDYLGRIKVQFHWDYGGPRNQYSSCFIRAAQGSWAGAGWGFQFIPRIGMEVLVAFIGGDLDNPVVIGAINNGVNPPTHMVPGDKTWSGIRTQTTPGGDGYNEIAFNDRAGSEELYVRAQKDKRELVQHDRMADIRNDDYTRVRHDQTIDVTNDQRTIVQRNRFVQVVGDQTETVMGDRLDVVNGRGSVSYVKDLLLSVAGNEERRIAGVLREEVTGDAVRRIAGDATTLVVGKTPRASLLHVQGTSRMTSSGTTEIVSEKEVVIRCGNSVLRILPNAIELVAPEVRVRAPGSGIKFSENKMEIRAKDGAAFKAKEVTLQSEGATVKLDTTTASVQASQIALGTTPSPLDKAKDEAEKTTKINLKDQKNKPIANRHYVVVTKKGDRIGGMVGKDGKDEIYLEEGDKIEFRELGDPKAGK